MTYLLFDIGGTNTRVALSHDHETLGEIVSFKTKNDVVAGVKAMADAAVKLGASKDEVYRVAGGIRGLINPERTGIQNDAILTGWAGKSVAREFKKYFEAEFVIENDTAIAGLGEATYGAGKHLPIIAYHTVSTGVGGVKIENGQIDDASMGFEPGHQILDIDRTILGDEVAPTLENLVSGAALEVRMGTSPKEIPQSDVIWDDLAGYLAQGLRNTVLYWSPDAVILGGSMILGNPCIDVAAVRKYTVEALDGFVDCPLITKAALGDSCGLWGALALARQHENA